MGPIRVLLADDHYAMRLGLRATLQGAAGIEVVGEARTGDEAVAMATRLLPDVVLMDVNMPGLDGYEATRRICAALPSVRVIAMSMYDESEAADLMREAGAVAYVNKTALRARLLDTIRAHGRRDDE